MLRRQHDQGRRPIVTSGMPADFGHRFYCRIQVSKLLQTMTVEHHRVHGEGPQDSRDIGQILTRDERDPTPAKDSNGVVGKRMGKADERDEHICRRVRHRNHVADGHLHAANENRSP